MVPECTKIECAWVRQDRAHLWHHTITQRNRASANVAFCPEDMHTNKSRLSPVKLDKFRSYRHNTLARAASTNRRNSTHATVSVMSSELSTALIADACKMFGEQFLRAAVYVPYTDPGRDRTRYYMRDIASHRKYHREGHSRRQDKLTARCGGVDAPSSTSQDISSSGVRKSMMRVVWQQRQRQALRER